MIHIVINQHNELELKYTIEGKAFTKILMCLRNFQKINFVFSYNLYYVCITALFFNLYDYYYAYNSYFQNTPGTYIILN